MTKPRLQVEEKYSGDIKLEKILILTLSSDITKVDETLLILASHQKGINYGLR